MEWEEDCDVRFTDLTRSCFAAETMTKERPGRNRVHLRKTHEAPLQVLADLVMVLQ